MHPATGVLPPLRPGGPATGTSARFYNPYGVALSPSGTFALIADYTYDLLRHIDVDTAVVTTLAGALNSAGTTDGIGTSARLNAPSAVCLADEGRVAFVTDQGSGRLRRIDVGSATVTTIAGSTSSTPLDGVGTNARFYNPAGIAATADGKTVFVTDFSGHKVRKVDVTTRTVTTLAGRNGNSAGSADGIGETVGVWPEAAETAPAWAAAPAEVAKRSAESMAASALGMTVNSSRRFGICAAS